MMPSVSKVKDHAHPVATSQNGKAVYADLMKLPLSYTVGRNPHLLNIIDAVISAQQLREPVICLEHDTGRSVGYGEIVETTEKDTIFYARQTKAATFTRFVKNRSADATQFITICLTQDEDGDYELTNAWIGTSYPALPDEPDATKASSDFWANHAVVYNGQSIVTATLTKDSPYEIS